MNRAFSLIKVTKFGYELVQDLEAAHYHFAATDEHDPQAVGDAYAVLCLRRKALYNYLEYLERFLPNQSEPRTSLRFD